MEEVGTIKIGFNANSRMYSRVYKEVPLYDGTGGLYFLNGSFEREQTYTSDPRITFLRLNGVIVIN